MKRLSLMMAVPALALSILMMPGCSQINVADYSGFTNIPPSGIPTNWEYEFSPAAFDSTLNLTKSYDVVIAVRYTNLCPSQSVIFNIEQLSLTYEQPDSATVEIPLFDKDGKALGHSRYGVNETLYTLRTNYKLPEGYVLSLSSPLPEEATAGIKSVGLLLVSEDNREKRNNLFWQL